MAASPSYGILGSILAAAAGLYAYLGAQHAEAGHVRHDAQAAALEQKVNNTAISFENRLHEHILLEGDQVNRIADSVTRIESKLDAELTAHGHRFPTDGPPLMSVPLERRPNYISDGGVR